MRLRSIVVGMVRAGRSIRDCQRDCRVLRNIVIPTWAIVDAVPRRYSGCFSLPRSCGAGGARQRRPQDGRRQAMFKSDLFAGQRVLVTGGGTGLDSPWPTSWRRWAPNFTCAGGACRCWTRPRRGCARPTAAWSPPMRWTSATLPPSTPWSSRSGRRTARSTARSTTRRATSSAAPRTCHPMASMPSPTSSPRHLLHHPGGRQALDPRWPARRGAVHRRHLGLDRLPFVVPSAMSKAGVDAMTKSLAVEWGATASAATPSPRVIPTEGAGARLRPTDARRGDEWAEPDRPARPPARHRQPAAFCWRAKTAGSTARPSPSMAATGWPTAPISSSTGLGRR